MHASYAASQAAASAAPASSYFGLTTGGGSAPVPVSVSMAGTGTGVPVPTSDISSTPLSSAYGSFGESLALFHTHSKRLVFVQKILIRMIKHTDHLLMGSRIDI